MRLECAEALAPASDVDRKDCEGISAIDYAKRLDDAEMVKMLEYRRLAQAEARALGDCVRESRISLTHRL